MKKFLRYGSLARPIGPGNHYEFRLSPGLTIYHAVYAVSPFSFFCFGIAAHFKK